MLLCGVYRTAPGNYIILGYNSLNLFHIARRDRKGTKRPHSATLSHIPLRSFLVLFSCQDNQQLYDGAGD